MNLRHASSLPCDFVIGRTNGILKMRIRYGGIYKDVPEVMISARVGLDESIGEGGQKEISTTDPEGHRTRQLSGTTLTL